MNERFLRFSDVREMCGRPSRATIWRWQRAGLFPKSRRIGPNSSAWLLSEVQEWMRTKMQRNAKNETDMEKY